MLRIYSVPIFKKITKRAVLFTSAFAIAFSSIGGLALYSNRDTFVNAQDCSDVFSPIPQWVNEKITANKSTYVQVQNEKGVPWQMLAAIHLREFNLSVSNPNNGQGIYQLYSSGTYFPPGAVSQSEFLRQTRLAADFLQKKSQEVPNTSTISARKLKANEDNLNLIKSVFFSYNGRASSYAQQAATYGYDPTSQPFEGSPYVMSKFDCKRKAMGLITTDGSNSLTSTDTRMGAFTFYARLKGDAYWNSLQVGNIAGCAEATGTTVSCVWRLYNPGKKNYVYTTSFDQRNRYIAMGYTYQNTSFYGRNPAASKVSGQIPVYSLFKGDGSTFLTTNQAEYSALRSAQGWADNGIAFYANPAGSNAGFTVHRLYSSTTGAHVWTDSSTERANLIKAGYASEGTAFNAISPVRQESPAPSGQVLVYRFGDMPGNTHFWTTDLSERDRMIKAKYRYEGVAWRAYPTKTSVEVYRLYSPTMRKHLFTTDSNEKNILSKTSSWTYEGIAWYSNPSTAGKPVYRLYSAYNAEHFFTTSSYERDQISKPGGAYRYEGVSWRQP